MHNIIQKIVNIHTKLILKIINTSVYKKIVQQQGHIINDFSKCSYCSICESKCPIDAIKVDSILSQWKINDEKCVRCRKCLKHCPKKSISLNK